MQLEYLVNADIFNDTVRFHTTELAGNTGSYVISIVGANNNNKAVILISTNYYQTFMKCILIYEILCRVVAVYL